MAAEKTPGAPPPNRATLKKKKDSPPDSSSAGRTAFPLFLFALLALPFLPLLLSLAEYAMFGTNHVEEFFKRIGLYELLATLYSTVLSPFMR